MDYYLGIDLGTSSVRVIALDANGTVLAAQGRDYPIHEPHPGFSEQSTGDWWDATADCLRRLHQLESLKNARARAIGLSGQMHGLVLLDTAGNALRRAIIWPDRRTASICREWSENIGSEKVGAITGLPIATGFMAPSLSWVKHNEPEIYGNAAHALLPKDFIRYKLTGEIATDVTDASASLLFDVAARRWSTELLRLFDLDAALLPTVIGATSIAGTVTEAAAAATGLPPGIPVAAGGADIAMTALALGADRPGTAVVSISTGGTVITGIDRPILDSRLHTFCSVIPDHWILMGATLSAGLSLSWFARNIAVPLGYPEEGAIEKIVQDAQSVPAGSEGLLFAPYLCGERTPFMDPHAKGCFIGLSLRHTHAHMARAILEGVAYSLCETFDALDELHLPVNTVLCSGGGARSHLWRQILADTFNRPILRQHGEEHSGIGAAMAAARAVGDSVAAGAQIDVSSNATYPRSETSALYRKQRTIFKQIYPQLAGVFASLSSMDGPS